VNCIADGRRAKDKDWSRSRAAAQLTTGDVAGCVRVAGSADAVDRERLRSDASVEPSAGTVAAAGRAPRDSRQDSYDAKTGRPTTAPRPSMIVDQHRHVQETREAWRQRGSRDFLELRGKQIRWAPAGSNP
jgi:hypothetical protein